jgi:hypothetical protein
MESNLAGVEELAVQLLVRCFGPGASRDRSAGSGAAHGRPNHRVLDLAADERETVEPSLECRVDDEFMVRGEDYDSW